MMLCQFAFLVLWFVCLLLIEIETQTKIQLPFTGGVSDNTMLQQSGVIGDFDGMVVVTGNKNKTKQFTLKNKTINNQHVCIDKGFRSEAFGREINTVMCHAAIR